MAKTVSDLKKSRLARQKIVDEFGEVPCSVWVASTSESKKVYDDTERQEVQRRKELIGKIPEGTMEAFHMSGMSVRGKDGVVSLSKFPLDILQRALRFYTQKGDLVLDPCAGHNSRMQGVYEMERFYIGYDVCHEFMEFNRKIAEKIQKKNEYDFFKSKVTTITLHEQSSEQMVEQDSSVDFVFTSPPYWDLEYYDDHPGQLGYKKTYEEFLAGLGRIGLECLRVLKPGKFCVFNVNDFRKNGKLYAYHADLIRVFLGVGWELFDIGIMVWSAPPIRSCFAQQVVDTKILGKAHEYLLVFRKGAAQ